MTTLQRHVLFWIAYVLFKTFLNVSDKAESFDNLFPNLAYQASLLVVKIPVVYFCFFVIDKYLEIQWKLWTSVTALVAAIAVGSVALSVYNHRFALSILHLQSERPVLDVGSLVYHSFTLTFVAGVAVSIRLFRRQHRSQVREATLQKEKTEAELKYLKGQINPHFLFNTLNNIYSLAMKGSDQTAEAVLRLSKMMRFVLYEAGSPTIPLHDELRLIKDYIELEKLRYTNRLEIKYAEDVDNPDLRIAPLLLIHFVENAFKHGVSESRTRSFVNIDISLKDKILKAVVVNSKADVPRDGVPIGMDNIKKQLNILYPHHSLRVNDNHLEYSIHLTIPFR